jgi:hypothetical protein
MCFGRPRHTTVSGWEPTTPVEVIDLHGSLGAPPEILAGIPFIFDAIDASDDWFICTKRIPGNPGPGLNSVDNTWWQSR